MADTPKTVVQGHAPNLDTIIKAAKAGHLALMECKRVSDGKIVAVLCCVGWDAKTEEHVFAPMAEMFEDNPYEQWLPPKNPNPPFEETYESLSEIERQARENANG